MQQLFWRIWIAVVLVALAVLALFVFLATLQFQKINSDLTSDRLAILADRTAEPFQTPSRIGLPLSTVRNAPAFLERARQTDERIRAVHVFDGSGAVVYSTTTPAPSMLPPLAMSAYESAASRRWQVANGRAFYSGMSLSDGAGHPAGGVLIEYPSAEHLTRVRAMAAELGFAAIGGFAAISVIGAIVLRIVLWRIFRGFRMIEVGITRFEQGAWRSAAGVSDQEELLTRAGQLHRDLHAAEERYRTTGKRLADLAGPAGSD